MRMTPRFFAALACALLWSSAPFAQSSFPTVGGSNVDGKVEMCWNGVNAVPCGAAVPLPTTITQGGNAATVSLDGALSVNTPANPEFTDLFSAALDTTTNWTTNNSGGTTATASGSLVISGTTTLSQYAGLSTKQSWTPAGISPQIFGVVAVYNTLVVTNSVRIFGVYTSPATPTLAAPVTDGYVFRLDATGALFAEIWSAGAVAVSSNITAVTGCAPTAGVPNLYYVSFRTNLVQFGCGNNPSAFITVVNPANQTLPISAYSIAGLSNPGSAATLTLTGLSLSSQSGASVKSAGQAPTINDPYILVGISPNSPGSGGGGGAVTQSGNWYIGTYTIYTQVQVPNVATGTPYASGRLLGGKLTIPNMARSAGATGTINSVILDFQDAQTGTFDLYLFDSDPTNTTFTDNLAFSIAAADINKVFRVVHIADCPAAAGTVSSCQANGIGQNFATTATTNIYGALVTRSSPVFGVANDIMLRVQGQNN